jgi:hypothetical protein
MAAKKELCRASNGVFVRNLGWKMTASGGYTQHKFYLGRDESKARLAGLRLEQLWQQVCVRWNRENLYELHPTKRPVWDGVTLDIAEAVRNGEAVARVRLPMPLSAFVPESPLIGDWHDQLQSDITVIKIELHDEEAQDHSEDFLQKQGHRLLEMGRRMLRERSGGESLHAALNGYSRWISSKYVDTEKKPTAWCGTQVRQIAFMRRHLADCDLAELDAQRVEELIDVLRLRPTGEDGRSVSVSWTQSCIKQLRRFLRWLNRSPEFPWKRPTDLELPRVQIPLTAEEKSARRQSSQVQTYTLEELRLLWTYASPFQRLLMLLGLNCGFGRAEAASLEMGEIVLRQKHPHERDVGLCSMPGDSWLFRVRHKTGVYGEFKLWPDTVVAIEWYLRRRKEIVASSSVTTLLVTQNGRRYDALTKGNNANFRIPNSWFSLSERITKRHADFRRLSFNKLRKTAGNLMRSAAGGEIAGVFLCHGTPVKTDELLDLYTNRPFAKVFAAIDQVGQQLRPLWATIPEAFPCSDETQSPCVTHQGPS